MLDYQVAAINSVKAYAKAKASKHHSFVEQICKPIGVDARTVIDNILDNPITINFHPDRFAGNGKLIIDNLIEQGLYHGQFRTGTSNGGMSAYIGGDRFLWEQRLFSDSYPKDSLERPKYGALNIFRYIDGASPRFGSCFFTLKSHVINRCTFSYGDSATNPATICTSDTFVGILAGLLEDVQKNNQLLNKVIATEQEALAILLNPSINVKDIGKNLDYCVEAHVHGDVSLMDDIDCFYADESFSETPFVKKIKCMCEMYEIQQHWIPKRQLLVADIGTLFRGSQIPILAKRVDSLLGNNQGVVNAVLIGMASCDSMANPINWHDIGNDAEIFQYFKQLWHTVAFFG